MDFCRSLIDTVLVVSKRLASADGWRGAGALLVAALLGSIPCRSQTILNFSHLGGVVRIVNTDMAVLESPENRYDIPCRVAFEKAELGFDMRFHETYRITIPLRDLAGAGDQLRTLMRITPEDRPGDTVYMVDRFKGWPHGGHVTLARGERSRLADYASDVL